jgi:hypothetical protein
MTAASLLDAAARAIDAALQGHVFSCSSAQFRLAGRGKVDYATLVVMQSLF